MDLPSVLLDGIIQKQIWGGKNTWLVDLEWKIVGHIRGENGAGYRLEMTERTLL